MTQAFNAKTQLAARTAGGAEKVAEGVWVVRGGFPMKTMNVYLVETATACSSSTPASAR